MSATRPCWKAMGIELAVKDSDARQNEVNEELMRLEKAKWKVKKLENEAVIQLTELEFDNQKQYKAELRAMAEEEVLLQHKNMYKCEV